MATLIFLWRVGVGGRQTRKCRASGSEVLDPYPLADSWVACDPDERRRWFSTRSRLAQSRRPPDPSPESRGGGRARQSGSGRRGRSWARGLRTGGSPAREARPEERSVGATSSARGRASREAAGTQQCSVEGQSGRLAAFTASIPN